MNTEDILNIPTLNLTTLLYLNKISSKGVLLLINVLIVYNNTLECLNLSGDKLMSESSVDPLVRINKHTQSLNKVSTNCF
jgi:hypothetical protein